MASGCHVGFDIEWRPSFRKNIINKVALVQLSTDSSVLLVQTRRFGHFPTALKHALGREGVVKVGVGILDDLMKLNSDCGVPIGEFLDVGAVVKRIDNLDKTGLKHIMKHYFNVDTTKPKRVQMSNWEMAILTSAQIKYASQDALMGRLMYTLIQDKKMLNDAYTDAAIQIIRDALLPGSRAAYRQAFHIASESSTLMSYVLDYMKNEETVSSLLLSHDNQPRMALRSFCSRLDLDVSCLTVCHSPFCAVVKLNETVVCKVNADTNLSKLEKNKCINDMIIELLHRLIHGQRHVEDPWRLLLQYTVRYDFKHSKSSHDLPKFITDLYSHPLYYRGIT
eukprot:CAMPEP_0185022238 /NCGR_PEP_ID=MMETSP1103-20130426/4958_1 /TAXON_ID=36769 /ORGANISM="Paraphysomonas bandaiensis, Strain Caron Lab Isolate" /LENGTH=336 /DNA_ID=CAMNT_0027554221 /DNA_START=215 /DNA_END=1225 /DNA_ORIENTATION=-